jgi:hypothetical protein
MASSIRRKPQSTLFMLLRGLVLLVPAFMLVPQIIGTRGMWLAVPVVEFLTLAVIIIARKLKAQ